MRNDNNTTEGLKDFDWEGYALQGHSRKSGERKEDGERIFAVGDYVENAYKAYCAPHAHFSKDADEFSGSCKGSLFSIRTIKYLGNKMASVDTDSGMSALVDLDKDKRILSVLDGEMTLQDLCEMLSTKEGVEEFIHQVGKVYIDRKGNGSFYDGVILGVKEAMFRSSSAFAAKKELSSINLDIRSDKELDKKNRWKIDRLKREITQSGVELFSGVITGLNTGGYNILVNGVDCFMPYSQSSIGGYNFPGKQDKEEREKAIQAMMLENQKNIGLEVEVVALSYDKRSDSFVVSHKEAKRILASRICRNLIGSDKSLTAIVTGTAYYGAFLEVMLPDSATTFDGIIHFKNSSDEFKEKVEKGVIRKGDIIDVFVEDVTDEDVVILSDRHATNEKEDGTAES